MRDIFSQLLKYFWPSNLFSGLSFIFSEWHRSDTRNRAILLMIFAPMIVCVLGLLYSFAGFIFDAISRLLGWFLLSALFGGGGIFCYEKLRENRTSSPFSSPHQTGSSAYDATAESSEKSTRRTKSESSGREGSDAKTSARKKWF